DYYCQSYDSSLNAALF
nr:immunoglobulin light chain junction region [Macaca mulatta]MOY05138.1 immunoglobulin light chain junction region [Macaca mulatta]MOY05353.1 immunoglobulin light chain junction region [Macaca mulatta]MOY05547.1 immunoglobulin light chain junction region [Macaca mulatta]MOY05636.1 immunoglobulin light chain junction region [Macaca mulatta]